MLGLAHTVCHQVYEKTCWYESKCKDDEDGHKQVGDRVSPTKTMGAHEFRGISTHFVALEPCGKSLNQA